MEQMRVKTVPCRFQQYSAGSGPLFGIRCGVQGPEAGQRAAGLGGSHQAH